MYDLNIALMQADLAWQDKETNLLKFEKMVGSLDKQPDLVVLPEMFNTGFITDPHGFAETMEGTTVAWMKKMASDSRCVFAGSLAIEENGNYYNRLIWMQPDDKFLSYDKRHLFSMGNEQIHFEKGSKKLVAEIMGWKICPLICYDLRFPVWSMNTLKNGSFEYDLLLYVANWPASRSSAYRQLLVARAIENQCYVAAVNRIGIDGNGVNHLGESIVVDFKGNHMAEIAANTEGPETVMLSRKQLDDFRAGFNVSPDWDCFTIEV